MAASTLIAVIYLIMSQLAAADCDFNWSTQHLISNDREEDVENEATTEDLLPSHSAGFSFGKVTNRV
jgi:hypothetical protein